MGEVALAFQKNDSAQYFFQLASPIFMHHENWNEAALTKVLEAVNYYYKGDLQQANALLKTSFWEEHTLKREIYDLVLDLQGAISYQYGDLERAIEKFEETYLNLLDKPNKNTIDSSYLASHLNNLGAAYNQKGNIERSIDYYQSAKDIFLKPA